MADLGLKQLDVYRRIHDIVMEFGNHACWDPITGALLVCGIRPPATQGEPISNHAGDFLSGELKGTQSQILRAMRVYEAYEEEASFEDSALSMDGMTPVEFVQWCCETFGSNDLSRQPQWLAHYAAEMFERPAGMPPPPIDPAFLGQLTNFEEAAKSPFAPSRWGRRVEDGLPPVPSAKPARRSGPRFMAARALEIAHENLDPAKHFLNEAVWSEFLRMFFDPDPEAARGELKRFERDRFACQFEPGVEKFLSRKALGDQLLRAAKRGRPQKS